MSFNQLSKFKRLSVVYITIYQKEIDKNVYFGKLFFQSEIKPIKKFLFKTSKFESSIEKKV